MSGADEGTFFIAGCLIPDSWDGDGYKAVDVTLAGGRIAAIEPKGQGAPPAGATVVPGSDKLLLPGATAAATRRGARARLRGGGLEPEAARRGVRQASSTRTRTRASTGRAAW